MKYMKYFSFLLFYLFTFLPLPARDYVTVAGDLMKTRIYTLDNGLKVYLSVNKERPGAPDVQGYHPVRNEQSRG